MLEWVLRVSGSTPAYGQRRLHGSGGLAVLVPEVILGAKTNHTFTKVVRPHNHYRVERQKDRPNTTGRSAPIEHHTKTFSDILSRSKSMLFLDGILRVPSAPRVKRVPDKTLSGSCSQKQQPKPALKITSHPLPLQICTPREPVNPRSHPRSLNPAHKKILYTKKLEAIHHAHSHKTKTT